MTNSHISASTVSDIAVVEDDPILRAHFSDIIASCPKFNIKGMAGTMEAARSLLDAPPDLFLVDVGLPDGSGLDFIVESKKVCNARCLIVTSFGDRETIVKAIQLGADGYLLKDSDEITIIDGIELTLSGGAPISAAAAVYLLDHFRDKKRPAIEKSDEPELLTAREVEILGLFSKGLRYKEAAEVLNISPLTIGSHVKSIYRKLAVNSRSEAIFEAVKGGQLKM